MISQRLPASTQAPHTSRSHPTPARRIILENSGVAEPQNIRDKFNEAAAEGHPLLERLELDSLVTVRGRRTAARACSV